MRTAKQGIVLAVVLAAIAVSILMRLKPIAPEFQRAGQATECETKASQPPRPLLNPSPSLTPDNGTAASDTPEQVFERIAGRHREAIRADRLRHRDDPSGWTYFASLRIFHLDEARLYALLHPEEAEQLAMTLALNEGGDPEDRELGVFILGALAESGRQSSASAILGLARSGRSQWAASATQTLARIDRIGTYSQLFAERARAGDASAIQALGYWNLPGSKEVLLDSELSGRVNGNGEVALASKQSLAELDALSSPDWVSRVKSSISGPQTDPRWIDWAIRVASYKNSSEITASLKSRLEDAERRCLDLTKAYLGASEETDFSETVSYRKTFVESFLIAQTDRFYDEALIAYSRSGAELSSLEKQRLRALGYHGEESQRLAELMSDKDLAK